MRIFSILLSTLCFVLATCDAESPNADAAIDQLARSYLRTIESRDIDAIRRPLSARGQEEVTAHSMESIFGYFAGGSPASTTLLDAEVATSTTPFPATRHRLTYSVRFPNERKYHFFFEATIEGADTSITGFRIEPYE